jgi:hypothetical protein
MLVLGTIAAGVALGGCGGGEDEGPAALAPVDAPVYLDFFVRPEGEAAEGAEAALAKVIDSADPGAEVISLLEREAAEDGEDFDYEQEIEPWLGERVAFFFLTLGDKTTGALVAETTDPDKALEFVKSQEDATGEEQEYEGSTYQLDSDGDASGIVDDFLVVGDVEGFKAAVDASGESSLAESDEFKDSIDGLPEERLATFYALPKDFLNAIPAGEIDPQGRAFFLQAIGDAGDQPVLGDVTASEEAVTLEFSAGGGEIETNESALLEQLPANSWLGFGLADIGGSVQNGLEQLEKAGVPGLDAAAVRQQLRSQSGINLEQDVIDTLGDAALFVEGTSAKNVGGALVIESKDPAASAALIAKLQGLIKRLGDPKEVRVQPLASATGDQGFQLVDPSGELPQPVRVVQREGRIVAGYGPSSIEQALGGDQGGAQTLSGSPAFTSAKESLGDLGIDAFLSFAPVFQLAESAGAAADPDYKQAKPYVDSLDFLALGSGSDGDRASVRFVIGLK